MRWRGSCADVLLVKDRRTGGRAAFQVTDVSKAEDAKALMESTLQPKTDMDCLRRLPLGRTNCAARDRRMFM